MFSYIHVPMFNFYLIKQYLYKSAVKMIVCRFATKLKKFLIVILFKGFRQHSKGIVWILNFSQSFRIWVNSLRDITLFWRQPLVLKSHAEGLTVDYFRTFIDFLNCLRNGSSIWRQQQYNLSISGVYWNMYFLILLTMYFSNFNFFNNSASGSQTWYKIYYESKLVKLWSGIETSQLIYNKFLVLCKKWICENFESWRCGFWRRPSHPGDYQFCCVCWRHFWIKLFQFKWSSLLSEK